MERHRNQLNGRFESRKVVMYMDDIYTGIVSFNPDIERLKENISAISRQLPIVVVFDNGSRNIVDVEKVILEYKNVKLLKSDSNVGIAAALNRLMQWGFEKEYTWMLSLDQDSVCDEHYVSNIEPFLNIEPALGVVAPIIVDRKVGVIGHNPKKEYSHVNTCITSGAFSRISAWMDIGKYDESMFIDSVDFEFCYRMRKAGYGVIQIKKVKLLHELGKSQKRRFLFWRIDITRHNAFRKYYIARNNVYYPLKHHLWLRLLRGNFRNVSLIASIILYEDNRKKKIESVCKGWKDAYIVGKLKNGN